MNLYICIKYTSLANTKTYEEFIQSEWYKNYLIKCEQNKFMKPKTKEKKDKMYKDFRRKQKLEMLKHKRK